MRNLYLILFAAFSLFLTACPDDDDDNADDDDSANVDDDDATSDDDDATTDDDDATTDDDDATTDDDDATPDPCAGSPDADGDGVTECGPDAVAGTPDDDCDDADPDNFPGNTEVCDDADNDCDTLLSAEEIDNDGDGQTECDGDCDDTDPNNFSGNPEVCDGGNNDCDGATDAVASWEAGPDANDTDQDERFRGGVFLMTETIDLDSIEMFLDADSGTVLTWQVFEGAAHPGTMTEIASVTTTVDPADAGAFQFHSSGSLAATLTSGMYYTLGVHWADSTGYTYSDGDDITFPNDTPFGTYIDGANINEITAPMTSGDVNGGFDPFTAQYELNVHWFGEEDYDGDGELICTDCDDGNIETFTGAPEVCDSADNDCDGVIPADETTDADADGFVACAECADSDPASFPGAPEICDGLDNNCDGPIGSNELFENGAGTDNDFTATTGALVGNAFTTTEDITVTGVEAFLGAGTDDPETHVVVYTRSDAADPWVLVDSAQVAPPLAKDWAGSTALEADINSGDQVLLGFAWSDGQLEYDLNAPTAAPSWATYDGIQGSAANEGLLTSPWTPASPSLDSGNASALRIYTGLDEFDDDLDGVSDCEGDCNDADPSVSPDEAEQCGNGFDEDCAGGDAACGFWCITAFGDEISQFDGSGAVLTTDTITWTDHVIEGGNGMTVDPLTGTVYAILRDDAASSRWLTTLDLSTGVATDVGELGVSVGAGLAFDDAGILYMINGDGGTPSETLYTVDLTTAATTSILTLGLGDDGEALAFNPDDGLLYHLSGIDTLNAVDGRILETIDPVTLTVSAVTLVDGEEQEVTGASFDPATGDLLTTDRSEDLWAIDPVTGVHTLLADGTMTDSCRGHAVIAQ